METCLERKGGTDEQMNHLLKDLVVHLPFAVFLGRSSCSDWSCCHSPSLQAEHRVDGAPNQRYIYKAKSAQIRRMLRGTDGRVLFS